MTVGTVIKLLFLAAVNLLAVWSFPSMWSQKWWPGLIAVVLSTALIDWAYLSPRAIPAKYLVPGTIFALIFAVVPVLYNAFIAFTNFGTGNVLTREQAVDSITGRVSTVPGSTRFDLTLLATDDGAGEFALLLEDDAGEVFFGTADEFLALAPEDIQTDADGKVLGVGPYIALNLGQIADRQQELVDLEVTSDEGTIKVLTVSSAAVYEPLYAYDDATGTITDMETGIVYAAVEGTFTSPDGDTINPGYRAFIGWDNFTRILTSEAIRGPFLRVFIWNYAFAILSVITTFALGLGLAMALNHPNLRGKRLYRSLLIIPYALPSFMTALIWQGMLNQRFGIINDLLNANIPWLRDPWMAKVSVLLVNLWLGFPYMFLIATGALQAIPAELKDAAKVDGAGARQIFRMVTFPLLLVTLAPLLIASFAFNFNNFNIIFLLNGGGPPIAGAQTPAGHTDILISYTFRLAFESGSGSDFGFAAAIASLIFIMVATISAIAFRRTRVLEELT
ncbi:MAG: maltose ABC transporter permease MalF [Actinomycetota bacterium]|nr:maltose ABC transporter permease MalF [Actinomycetota bacterium]